MARVPDVLLTCCSEEDEAEVLWRNEAEEPNTCCVQHSTQQRPVIRVVLSKQSLQVSFYNSAHCSEEPFSTLKTTSPEDTAAVLPDLELSRWRGQCQGNGSRPFADADLLEMLQSNMVEDSASFASTAFVSGAGAVEFRFDPPPKTCTIQDVVHKSLFLGWVQNQDCLFAGHVEARNSEKLVLYFYNSLDSKAHHTKLVALSIGNKFYLSCRQKKGDRPQLQLEKVETSLKPTLGKDMARFLFKLKGTSYVSFESVAHPGWFIATADTDSQPVRLHNLIGQDFYTEFYLLEL